MATMKRIGRGRTVTRESMGEVMIRRGEPVEYPEDELRYEVEAPLVNRLVEARRAGLRLPTLGGGRVDTTGLQVTLCIEPIEGRGGRYVVRWQIDGTRAQRTAAAAAVERVMREV